MSQINKMIDVFMKKLFQYLFQRIDIRMIKKSIVEFYIKHCISET